MKHGKSITALAVALLFTLGAGQAFADGRDRDRNSDRAVAHSTVKVHLSGQGHDQGWNNGYRGHDSYGWKGGYRGHDRGWKNGHHKHDYHRHGHGYAYGHYYAPRRPYVVNTYRPRYDHHDHGGLSIVLKF